MWDYTHIDLCICWHFDDGATSNNDDVLNEHGVLPLAVYLKFVLAGKNKGPI